MVDNLITLFPASAKANSDYTTLGLGGLTEAISCVVTEERNGAFELEMTYPVTGRRYNDITRRAVIVAKPNMHDRPQPFRIYAISKPINGVISVSAEHISYDLLGYAAQVLPHNSPVAGPAGYFARLNGSAGDPSIILPSGCPFHFNTNILSTTEFRIDSVVSVKKALGGMNGSILDTYHGEYKWDRNEVYLYDTESSGATGRGSQTSVSIRYGKNLTDFNQTTNDQNFYTGVYPFWHYMYDTLTDRFKHDIVELTEHGKIVYAPGFDDSSGYNKILPLDTTDHFMRRPSENDLYQYAQDYIKENKFGEPEPSFDVSFIPLAQTEDYKDFEALEKVQLCDTINVYMSLYGINATAKVIKTEYDVLGGKYNKISLGSYKKTASDTIATQHVEIQERVPTQISSVVTTATDLITGASGGHIVLKNLTTDAIESETPNELFIVENEDLSRAGGTWRWNLNGLGYSANGINGPYSFAITNRGEIDATFIKTGELDGGIIRAGTVQAESISQTYTDQVTNDITQAFIAADNQVYSYIADTKANLDSDIAQAMADISVVSQTAANLTAAFQSMSVGGNNKIQNSSGWNGVSLDWTTSSNGVTTLQDADEQQNTISGSAFRIINDTLSQSVTLMSGNQYHFGFRAKTTMALGASVSILDGETIIFSQAISTITGWTDYDTNISVSGAAGSPKQIKIVANSLGDSLYLADLMLVEGNVKCDWTPAPNEIYTTNVKIDRMGINITNADSNVQTLIDNTQFAVKYNNETVLTVNQALTELKKTQVKDELTLGDNTGVAKFVPVDGGIDLVLLV